MFDEIFSLFRLGIGYEEFSYGVGYFGLFFVRSFFVTWKFSNNEKFKSEIVLNRKVFYMGNVLI